MIFVFSTSSFTKLTNLLGWQGFHLLLHPYMWGGKGEEGGLRGGSGLLGFSKSSTVSSWMWGRNADGDGTFSWSVRFMGEWGVSLQPGEGASGANLAFAD
ncbi:hypothetical protein DSO57_1025883 [Entomophthora muscae]|uniref:Uncharacterized protein n=1 Tax=Entomophthora muscae TaxID=34485 RepID=A0ACC2TD52_9FUNG|nr:hypothetical protein DSO57_1025883 [Entomophthora muscae]